MISFRRQPVWRKFRASLRDTWLLFRQFQWPLLAYAAAIYGGGIAYFGLAQLAGEPIQNRAEAIYHILGLTLLSPIEEFPQAWYLEAFYFVMPIIGVGILAQGLADFGVLFFNRSERSKEWEMSVASTFRDHIVLIGLGHLGYRVANHLYSLGQDVIVIEKDPKADLTTSIQALDIPILADDGTREVALRAAKIDKARAVILCTQDDSLNLQMGLKARSINPKIEVVLRIFDDDFAQALEKQFGFKALSATGTASPVFAAAAAGVDMTRPITIEGHTFSLASFNIQDHPHLSGKSIGQIEKEYQLSVVFLRKEGQGAGFHPDGNQTVTIGDTIAIIGGAAEISSLVQRP